MTLLRFSSSPRLVACPILGRARPFFESGLREFNLRTDLISTYALQAACLLRDCSYAEGLKDQEALLGAQATRIAQMMAQRPEFYTDPVEREVNISCECDAGCTDLQNADGSLQCTGSHGQMIYGTLVSTEYREA